MGRFSRDEFLTRYPDSQNTVIPHHIYQYTYKEDISVERARQYLNLSQDAFIVTAFGKFRNREEIRMVLGAFRSWNEERKMLLAPRLYPFQDTTTMAGISSNDGFQGPDIIYSCHCLTAYINYRQEPTTS